VAELVAIAFSLNTFISLIRRPAPEGVTSPGPNPSWVWYYVNGIEWDGKYFGIGYGYLYRVMVTHGQAYYVGMTNFSSEDLNGPFWFYNNKPGAQATELVGAYSSEGTYAAYYWSYPGGQELYGRFHGIYEPAGVTVSLRTI
jgi:hypothetical protein